MLRGQLGPQRAPANVSVAKEQDLFAVRNSFTDPPLLILLITGRKTTGQRCGGMLSAETISDVLAAGYEAAFHSPVESIRHLIGGSPMLPARSQ